MTTPTDPTGKGDPGAPDASGREGVRTKDAPLFDGTWNQMLLSPSVEDRQPPVNTTLTA